MGDPQKEKQLYTYEEYLEIEKSSEERLEFHFGEIVSSTGSSIRHNRIILRIVKCIGDLSTEPYCIEIKTEVIPRKCYVYPDVVVEFVSNDQRNEYETVVRRPILIAEVLSKDTEDRNRNDKFKSYTQIPSLQYYLLVSQYEYKAELFARQAHDFWHYRSYSDPDAVVDLSGINVQLPLAKIFEGVSFES